MLIAREKVEKNRILIAVTLLFILVFVARLLFGSKLSFAEALLNFPFYIVVGLVYGVLLQYLNRLLSDKGLLSLLIYPIIGMAILVQFLIPPVMTLSWEPAAALYNGERHVADVLVVSGNCRNMPSGYTAVPVKKPAEWYELGRLVRLSSLDRCACRLEESCIPVLEQAIVASELLNETEGGAKRYQRGVFTIQGEYLAMPIAEKGCHYTGFVKFIIVPSWRVYLREGGKLCFD